MIGRKFAETLLALGASVVAVCDPVVGRARAVAELSDAASYADLTALLDGVAIDLLCVCSPPAFHHEAVMAAVARGCHVFCEKPLAWNLQQAREMRRAADYAGKRLGVGFKMRFEAVFAEAKALIDAGEIGAPMYAILSYFQQVPPPERAWYRDVGVLRDNIAHAIDMSNWLLNREPLTVRARLDHRLGYAGEDKAFLQVAYADGALASIHGGWASESYPPVATSDDILFQIVGKAGYVAGARSGHLVAATARGIDRRRVAPVDGFAAELGAFLESLDRGEAPPVDGRAGLLAQAVMEAAYQSQRTGATVEIAPLLSL